MAHTDEQWGAVAEHVAEAMSDHAMSQADLVRASGVSAFTVRRVMAGAPGNYRPDRLEKIGRALGWSGDSIERILAGGAPQVIDPPAGVVQRLEARVAVLNDALDKATNMLEEMTHASADSRRLLELMARELEAEREARLSSGLERQPEAPVEEPREGQAGA